MPELPPDASPADKSLQRRLLEMIRFSHTVFALPFALLACIWACVVPFPAGSHLVAFPVADAAAVDTPAAIATTASNAADKLRLSIAKELTGGQILLRIVGVLLCMISARSAAMAFNRLIDVKFDAGNPRTAGRHLVSGELSRRQVWTFFAVMVLMFFLSCTLFLPNWLPLAGALPVLSWICGYSLAKRFTSAAHLWLGVALALSPVCAWVAMRGEVLLLDVSDIGPAVGLALAIMCWVAGFDIIYACQDAAFDRRAGLHSLPARLGILGALRVAAVLHGLMLVVLATLPGLFPQLSLGAIYWTGLAVVAVLVIRQHAIIRPRGAAGRAGAARKASEADRESPSLDLGRINEAFFQINALLSFSLSIVAGLDALWR